MMYLLILFILSYTSIIFLYHFPLEATTSTCQYFFAEAIQTEGSPRNIYEKLVRYISSGDLQPCDYLVDSSISGHCVCGSYWNSTFSTFGHSPFTCEMRCNGIFSINSQQHYIQSVKGGRLQIIVLHFPQEMLTVIWTVCLWFHLHHLDIAFVRMENRPGFPIVVIHLLPVLHFASNYHPVSVIVMMHLFALHLLQVAPTIFN